MEKAGYRKGVFIAVYKKEKEKVLYLILKRKLHWKGWEFPKGKIENKETKLQAVKRELKEETGQTSNSIKKYNYKGKFKYQKKLPDREETGQTFNLYSAKIKSKKVKIDKREHNDYIWLNYNKALKKLTWNNQKKSLKIVNETIS